MSKCFERRLKLFKSDRCLTELWVSQTKHQTVNNLEPCWFAEVWAQGPCSDIRPWIFYWWCQNRTFSPVIARMQTRLKNLCKQISIPHPWNVKGHGGFGCLEKPFQFLSHTQSTTVSIVCTTIKLEYSQWAPHLSTERVRIRRTVAWPGSPKLEEAEYPLLLDPKPLKHFSKSWS